MSLDKKKFFNLEKIKSISSDSKFDHREIAYIYKALLEHDSGISFVNEFEKKFAKKFKINHAIACNSGTSGLHAALFSLGIGKNDEVIIPALTVIMDVYAVLHLGATPVFADVDESTHLITAQEIEKKISSRTKAVITVSWDGLSCDMDPIMKIAKKHNIKVIDDSARTVLGKYKNKIAGTIADIGVFSFESKKHLSAGGEGGMIVTNNSNFAKNIRKFAGIGYKHMSADAGATHLAIDTVQDPQYKRFDTIGLNYRMNNVTAAVGLGQLDKINTIVNRRKKIGKMFLKVCKDFKWFIPQSTPKNCEHSYYTFSVDYRGMEKLNISWKDFYNEYRKMGGDGFYGAVAIPYTEPALKNKLNKKYNWGPGLCPIAEKLQSRVMCFKTNYRDIEIAKKNVDTLYKLLKKLN